MINDYLVNVGRSVVKFGNVGLGGIKIDVGTKKRIVDDVPAVRRLVMDNNIMSGPSPVGPDKDNHRIAGAQFPVQTEPINRRSMRRRTIHTADIVQSIRPDNQIVVKYRFFS